MHLISYGEIGDIYVTDEASDRSGHFKEVNLLTALNY